MMQRATDPKRLQGTLDDLKRRLAIERQEAESMTHDLSAQREQGRLAEDSRVRRLEMELAAAQQQLAAQREESARMARLAAEEAAADRREMQLRAQRFEEDLAMLESRLADEHNAAERLAKSMRLGAAAVSGEPGEGEAGSGDEGASLPSLADYRQMEGELAAALAHAEQLQTEGDALGQRLKEAEAWGRALEEEESRLRTQLSLQKEQFEAQIAELHTERDEARANLQEVEGRTRAVEEEFVAAQEKSREQREAVREVIQQLEVERDDQRHRLSELEARAQWLEEELSAARRRSEEAGLPAGAEGFEGSEGTLAQKDLYWRLTVPLTLVMVSTDLLALNAQTSPQMREAVRAIQQESRRMLESLGQRGAATLLGSGSEIASPPPG